jgi:biopolymer transport protein ExbB/TolQ
MGIYRFPMIIIALAIAVLIVRKVIDLYIRKDLPPQKLEAGLHAILFWGAVSAVLGFLGQITGIYNALGAIMRATAISPSVIAQGFAESFTTTIFGIEILLVSAIVWFILYGRYRKLTAS